MSSCWKTIYSMFWSPKTMHCNAVKVRCLTPPLTLAYWETNAVVLKLFFWKKNSPNVKMAWFLPVKTYLDAHDAFFWQFMLFFENRQIWRHHRVYVNLVQNPWKTICPKHTHRWPLTVNATSESFVYLPNNSKLLLD